MQLCRRGLVRQIYKANSSEIETFLNDNVDVWQHTPLSVKNFCEKLQLYFTELFGNFCLGKSRQYFWKKIINDTIFFSHST